ncbi:hypothetical protein SEA_SEPHIROTH_104 [Gordonia Phage Sephiroth]|uniref:DUF7574 domain-containing protein n=2 Tax=Octobienvirus TaxID=3044779 RepID=A0AAE9C205_9CAUD|nr:hypothetical protein L3Y23_gp127 [Gordonia Phage Sephiroth]YP_010246620.1 hypothetical protein L3Y24_gp136 [Gordonia phage Kudefre]QNN99438.1 hypothetical protein SEA_SEPHIROTH_104 [Gordonia Phage Sephiroth]UDL15325.1 hypothetical protein SEA_KUDEFRE_107 [Gordonia phage Kudefre]
MTEPNDYTEHYGYTLVAEVEAYECYSWDNAGVFYDPDHNAYRVAADGGCSCNYPWDRKDTISECPPVGLAEAIQQFRKAAKDLFHPASYETIEEELRGLRAHAKKVGARP